ncbi:MAG TPA: ElyC/SanA/YdcF family protein [Terriglobales bacterium]|nr:ElyC/SanA/YdcF family protein [Terriglobales bacterium]
MQGWRRIALTLTGVVLLFALFLAFAGRLLVVDQPQPSDAIVVLAGGRDNRYDKGLEMLGKGYGKVLFFDARTDVVQFGRTPFNMGQEFIHNTAGALLAKAKMCPIRGDSTYEETEHIADCLRPTGAHRVLLVTSEYHTRRSFQIVRSRLPQYQWSVAAAYNPYDFGVNWWQHREWAKTTLLEWTKLVWWELVDRWH